MGPSEGDPGDARSQHGPHDGIRVFIGRDQSCSLLSLSVSLTHAHPEDKPRERTGDASVCGRHCLSVPLQQKLAHPVLNGLLGFLHDDEGLDGGSFITMDPRVTTCET